MTPQVMEFVQDIVTHFNVKGKILDVGAFDVNGCTRSIFEPECEYVGLDMQAGSNVDVVAKGDAIPFPDNEFDCVVTVEMLEHDDNPYGTIAEMKRVLKPGGMIIVTARGILCGKHGYPQDYWRFTNEGLQILLQPFEEVYTREDQVDISGTYGYGKKPLEGGI